jgi:hypothetical protein
MKKLLTFLAIVVLMIGIGAKPVPKRFTVDSTACYVNHELGYGGTFSCDVAGTGAGANLTSVTGTWQVVANDGNNVTVEGVGTSQDATSIVDFTAQIDVDIALQTLTDITITVIVTNKATGVQRTAKRTSLDGTFTDSLMFNNLQVDVAGMLAK